MTQLQVARPLCQPFRRNLHLARSSSRSAGNLELHRGLAGQSLFTNINVGLGDHAFQSGGPSASGPNTVAFTTAWNVWTSTGAAMPPPGSNTAKQGECSFGPDMTVRAGGYLKGWRDEQASWRHYQCYKMTPSC